jgi:glyoxylase-like metal-dependent hydrolase (beta-lactamase superfamily II)/rhodanese-related sulfurtransferase
MILQQLFDPKSSTYTYLLAGRVGGEALIIDPVFEQVDLYLALLSRLRLKLKKAIDTHVHADHISGLGALRDVTQCVTVMGEQSSVDLVSMRVRDGDVFGCEGVSLKALYTPGHTDDSYCFLMGDRVFTGDTLLIRGSGRTDFQNGSADAAYHSIFEKLLTLPDDTLVYPGHDYNGHTVSTIGDERKNNPRLQVNSAGEYAAIMAGLKLANPKMMDVAVPANRAMGLNQKRYIDAGLTLPAEQAVTLADALFVDLREPAEQARDGVIPGSLSVPYDKLDEALTKGSLLEKQLLTAPQKVVFYCAFGERSALALDRMKEKGLPQATHLLGGLAAWARAGGPVVQPGAE